jgi:hypothetical protein
MFAVMKVPYTFRKTDLGALAWDSELKSSFSDFWIISTSFWLMARIWPCESIDCLTYFEEMILGPMEFERSREDVT